MQKSLVTSKYTFHPTPTTDEQLTENLISPAQCMTAVDFIIQNEPTQAQ